MMFSGVQREQVTQETSFVSAKNNESLPPPISFPSPGGWKNNQETLGNGSQQLVHPITPNPNFSDAPQVPSQGQESPKREEDTFDAAILLTTMRRSVFPDRYDLNSETKESPLEHKQDSLSTVNSSESSNSRCDTPQSLPQDPLTGLIVPQVGSHYDKTVQKFELSRRRTVSIDCSKPVQVESVPSLEIIFKQVTPDQAQTSTSVQVPNNVQSQSEMNTPCVSPPSSPVLSPRLVDRRKRYMADKDDSLPHIEDTSMDLNQCNSKNVKVKPLVQKKDSKKRPQVKRILRKKFSWKNYPLLESFLIANREEYLCHSALNYTMQQKQYNNRLTERLIELAQENGYIFDDEAFSFVTVRDRIRCYFKSYVQSRKKRGHIIGYAARKAGLLSDEELEKIAGKRGKIVIPRVQKK